MFRWAVGHKSNDFISLKLLLLILYVVTKSNDIPNHIGLYKFTH